MKRLIIFILLLVGLIGGSVCFSQSNNTSKSIKKASEKETIYVTVTDDQVKDTIASLEKDGWTFEAMAYNRADRTWTITMSRWNTKKVAVSDSSEIIGDKIPDGTYYINSYPYHGRMVRAEIIIKDNMEVSRKLFTDD